MIHCMLAIVQLLMSVRRALLMSVNGFLPAVVHWAWRGRALPKEDNVGGRYLPINQASATTVRSAEA